MSWSACLCSLGASRRSGRVRQSILSSGYRRPLFADPARALPAAAVLVGPAQFARVQACCRWGIRGIASQRDGLSRCQSKDDRRDVRRFFPDVAQETTTAGRSGRGRVRHGRLRSLLRSCWFVRRTHPAVSFRTSTQLTTNDGRADRLRGWLTDGPSDSAAPVGLARYGHGVHAIPGSRRSSRRLGAPLHGWPRPLARCRASRRASRCLLCRVIGTCPRALRKNPITLRRAERDVKTWVSCGWEMIYLITMLKLMDAALVCPSTWRRDPCRAI